MTPIASHSTPFPNSPWGFVASFHNGRRSKTLYFRGHYGLFGVGLANPMAPVMRHFPMSYRDVPPGPLPPHPGGGDFWPGPADFSIADGPSGAVRAAVGFTPVADAMGCQAVKMSAGGVASIGQQVAEDQTIAFTASTFLKSGKQFGYYVQNKVFYGFDMTTLPGNVNLPYLPVTQINTAANLINFEAIGDTSFDRFMVLLTSESNNTQRAIRIARLNDDGTLTVLPSFVLLTTSSEPGPGPVVTAMWNGSTYTIAVLLKNGVNIFHFDGTTLTHTNVLPHPAASPYYSVVTPSIAPPASILLCGRANGDVDVWTGAGSGAPSNFGTAARPVNYLNGFGAWIDPLAPAVLYTYRVTTPDGLTYFLVSESWSVPGGTPPPVDPHAADLVTLKTAVAAATISTEAVAPCKTFLAAMGV